MDLIQNGRLLSIKVLTTENAYQSKNEAIRLREQSAQLRQNCVVAQIWGDSKSTCHVDWGGEIIRIKLQHNEGVFLICQIVHNKEDVFKDCRQSTVDEKTQVV